MSTATEPKKPRKSRVGVQTHNAKGLPHKEIAQAIERGEITPTEAAKKYGCNRANVYHILDRYGVDRSRLDSYKSSRADVLADLGFRATGLLHGLIKKAASEKVLDALQPGQMGGLIAATTTLLGVVYDKERLERGQSTANVASLLHVAQQRADRECCGVPGEGTVQQDGGTE